MLRINKTQLVEMLHLQHKNNLNTIPEYYYKNIPWEEAVVAEAGECLESLSYKWWKSGKVDIDNVKMELVDIWHFLLSQFIIMTYKNGKYSTIDDKLFDQLSEHIVSNLTIITHNLGFTTNRLVCEVVARSVKYDRPSSITSVFLDAIESVGMSWDDLVKLYLTKNALNTLRQNHGYKSGTYVKLWKYGTDRVEDNYVVVNLVSELTNPTFDSVYKTIEEYYLSVGKTED